MLQLADFWDACHFAISFALMAVFFFELWIRIQAHRSINKI